MMVMHMDTINAVKNKLSQNLTPSPTRYEVIETPRDHLLWEIELTDLIKKLIDYSNSYVFTIFQLRLGIDEVHQELGDIKKMLFEIMVCV